MVQLVTEARKKFLASHQLDPNDVDVWRLKWQRVKFHSDRRGLKCLLSFEDYVGLAIKVGITKPAQIGVNLGKYQLGRYGDVGDYSLANCRFILREQNMEEWELNGGKASMAAALAGRSKSTHQGNLEQSKKVSKSFEVKSPNGQVFLGTNLTDFCKLHGLNRGNMSAVCRGDMDSYKGWTGKYV